MHVVVSGDVQGVGYRYTMRMVAARRRRRRLGAQPPRRHASRPRSRATPAQVDEVLAWMAEGPPGSRVDAAQVTDAAPTGERGFEVRD